MTELHAAAGPPLMVLLAGLSIVAAAIALRGDSPAPLELPRRLLLAILVAQAAIGLAIAVRGGGPAEGIHWFYGVAIILVLLAAGAVRPELSPRQRSGALVLGAVVATALAWRLGASG